MPLVLKSTFAALHSIFLWSSVMNKVKAFGCVVLRNDYKGQGNSQLYCPGKSQINISEQNRIKRLKLLFMSFYGGFPSIHSRHVIEIHRTTTRRVSGTFDYGQFAPIMSPS
ncbi:uncharacterized protein RJT20DRAFT_134370 [Scheffersomyces xylosifermentans]|uniref:uncharacterized protein n=1 Tax=Scheffersomyces xylosifermentans TaxID=1304137 RepID=UPI00315C8A52